jgi:hypothetical protein
MKTFRVFLWIAVLFGASSWAHAQCRFSFNPAPNATYTFHSKTEQTGKYQVMGNDMPASITVEMTYAMNVKGKTADAVDVSYSFKDVALSLSTGGMHFAYDSRTPSASPNETEVALSKILSGLLAKSFEVRFGTDGSVQSISGLNALIQQMMSATGDANNQMAGPMLQSFSDESMKSTFEQSFKYFPNRPVNVGDTWDATLNTSLGSGMNTDMKSAFQLKSYDANQATLSVNSTFSMGGNSTMTMALNGTATGEIQLDLKTGMPSASSTTQTIKGKIKMQETEVGMDIVAKTTLTKL